MGKWLKRSAVLAGLFLVAVAAIYGVAWVKTERALARVYEVADPPLQFAGDAAEAARGKHLFNVLGCGDCHGPGGAGREVFDGGPVGRMVAPNLTPPALSERYNLNQLAAAIRHGVGSDGLPLVFMPVGDFKNLSDADTAALARHVQTLPPSDNDPGVSRIGPLGRVLFLAGKLDLVPAEGLDHSPRVRTSPAQGATAEYGGYLAQVCTGCHGADFAGQHVPGTPPEFPDAANLTPQPGALAGWTEADFFRAMREGRRPDGRELDGFMPWRVYAAMTDEELQAIWLHLSALPPKPGTGKPRG